MKHGFNTRFPPTFITPYTAEQISFYYCFRRHITIHNRQKYVDRYLPLHIIFILFLNKYKKIFKYTLLSNLKIFSVVKYAHKVFKIIFWDASLANFVRFEQTRFYKPFLVYYAFIDRYVVFKVFYYVFSYL